MRFQPLIRRISPAAAAAAATGILLAGCGSSTPQASSSSPPSPTGAASSTGGASSAESAIKANWAAFFAASTPVSKRVALLQNGEQFRALIAAQAKSPLASSASAKVTKVSDVSSSQATVTYSILVAGTTALPHQSGVAVFEDGTWKVGDKSFCGLLTLENGKKSSLPAACLSAG